LEKTLEIIFPTNNEKKLKVTIEEDNENLMNILEDLAKDNKFILNFLKCYGITDDGPLSIIHNKQLINFDQLPNVFVKPGDKLYFILPILGG